MSEPEPGQNSVHARIARYDEAIRKLDDKVHRDGYFSRSKESELVEQETRSIAKDAMKDPELYNGIMKSGHDGLITEALYKKYGDNGIKAQEWKERLDEDRELKNSDDRRNAVFMTVKTISEKYDNNPAMKDIPDLKKSVEEFRREREREHDHKQKNSEEPQKKPEPQRQSEAASRKPISTTQQMSADLAELYRHTRDNIEKLPDEAAKVKAEKTLSEMMRTCAPLITEADRRKIGRGLEHDATGTALDNLDPNDPSPVRQRAAALREAGNPEQKEARPDRANGVETREWKAAPKQPRPDKDQEADPRRQAAENRLDQADKQARALFTERGMNADLAMQRIHDGADVDRATREKWLERDISAWAAKNNASTAQARDTVAGAYKEAAAFYAEARNDIRAINRGFAAPDRTPRPESEPAARNTSREKPISAARARREGRDQGIDR